jgi:hypothetical protein
MGTGVFRGGRDGCVPAPRSQRKNKAWQAILREIQFRYARQSAAAVMSDSGDGAGVYATPPAATVFFFDTMG